MKWDRWWSLKVSSFCTAPSFTRKGCFEADALPRGPQMLKWAVGVHESPLTPCWSWPSSAFRMSFAPPQNVPIRRVPRAVNELADWLQEGQDWARVRVSFLSHPQEWNFSPHHRHLQLLMVKKAEGRDCAMGEGEWEGGTVSYRGGEWRLVPLWRKRLWKPGVFREVIRE